MGKLIRFLGGAAVGAAIGTAAAVFLAPQSGKELQGRIMARREAAMAAARTEAASRERALRAELGARMDALAIKRHALKD
ncbi:MAG: YtxH domain-containing protein [Chloroflexia bacterium]|nr:YtxH domain-containing protein [Chloroflexia bacterium]